MKRKKMILGGCLLMTTALTAFAPEQEERTTKEGTIPEGIEGAWQVEGNPKRVALIVDGYFTVTVFGEQPAEFISTMGGTFSYDGSTLEGVVEFNSAAQDEVGQRFSMPVMLNGDKLTVNHGNGRPQSWTRIKENGDNLAGVWRITRREVDGEMREMPLRARRTLKILTGSRFQWAAINVETGEFSGTGGGTYTFENGKYTENIEFFSRDNSRVGMSLGFEGELKGDDWHHRGKSSKGDPIYEVWSRFGD